MSERKEFVGEMITNARAIEAANGSHNAFNQCILQALIGASIESGKKGTRLKFTKPLPTDKELQEIATLCDQHAARMASEVEDDMDIPVDLEAPIPQLAGKVNDKALEQYVLNPGGIAAAVITAADCITINTWAKEARKNRNIKIGLIVGGVILVTAAAVTAGVIVYNHKKKEDEKLEHIETDDVPEIEMDDDYPEVVLDDATIDTLVAMGF